MIVLDEQLKDHHLIAAISAWYPGTVTHIQTLRPNTIVKDDNISTLLLTASNPTFVTINVDDFWRKIPAHPNYTFIAIDLPQNDADALPDLLRQLLLTPLLRTRNARLGKVIYAQANRVRYYGRDKQVHDI